MLVDSENALFYEGFITKVLTIFGFYLINVTDPISLFIS